MSNIRIRFDAQTSYTRDWLVENEEHTQRILASFKEKGATPLCECNANYPPMYIAQRTRYYLARNPGTGNLHSPDCPSFEMLHVDSGRNTYESDVIKSKIDGTLTLKILSPLSIRKVDRADRVESDVDSLVPPRPKAPTDKREAMSLKGMLALLWEEAGLNKWHPGFNNRRIWAVARKRILDVAQRIFTKRINLADVIYMPEHFSEGNVDAINARRIATFNRIMTSSSTSQRFMVVVAGLRKVTVQEKSISIMLGHQSNSIKYWGGPHIIKKVENEPVLEILNNNNDPRIVYTIMVVSRDADEVLHIQDIGFLITDMHMIPTHSEYDRHMTEKLVMEGHKFIKTMRFDGASNEVYPDYLLVNDPAKPMPLAIFQTFASEAVIEKRFQAKARWKEEYGHYWIWDMETQGERIPELPSPK